MKQFLEFSGTVKSFDQEFLFAQAWKNSPRPKYNFLFLHGVGGDSNATIGSIQQTLAIIKNCRCIAYDLRGHGLSSHHFPENLDKVEVIGAYDLQAICNFFKLKKMIPIGHCFAGMILLTYTQLKLAPSFEQAIFINTPLNTRIKLPVPRKWWLQLLRLLPSGQAKKRSWQFHLHFKDTFDLDPVRVVNDFLTTGVLNLTLSDLAIINWSTSDYKDIDKPGFVFIRGSHDLFFPPNFQKKSLQPLQQVQKKQYDMNHHQMFTKYPALIAKQLLCLTNQKF